VRLLARFLVVAAAVWLVAVYVPGVTVSEGVGSYFWIALVFAAVNLLVKPALKLLSFPLLLLTLGLFLVVINAALFGLTAWLTERLAVDGVGPAVVASLVISVVTWVGDNVVGLDRGKG
jgi:putative membrane protein